MISSRDVLKQSKEIRQQHTLENLKQIIEQQVEKQVTEMAAALGMSVKELIGHPEYSLPILVQTLITPIVSLGIIPDSDLYKDKIRAIETICQQLEENKYQLKVGELVILKEKIAFYQTNHPQNLHVRGKFISTSDTHEPQNYNKVDPKKKYDRIINTYTPIVQKDENSLVDVNKELSKTEIEHKESGINKSESENSVSQSSVKYACDFVANAIKIQEFMQTRLTILGNKRRKEIYEKYLSQVQKVEEETLDLNESSSSYEEKNQKLKQLMEEWDRLQSLPSLLEINLKKNIELLDNAIKEYKKVLGQGRGLESHNREMILSSLEQVIVELTGGIAYGSCVSGKDRKGLETLHTNAMWIFIQLNTKVPDMDDVSGDRKLFVEIFAQLFVTRHQQENAGQNAPGANGIKTPEKYLPQDILDAISAIPEIPEGKRILDESDRLATNNEADKCIKNLKNKDQQEIIQQNYSKHKKMGLYKKPVVKKQQEIVGSTKDAHSSNKQNVYVSVNTETDQFEWTVGPKTASDFIELLERVLSNKQYWKGTAILRLTDKNRIQFGEAKGIQQIRKVLNDPKINTAEKKLEAIKVALLERGQSTTNRRKRVRELYNLISNADGNNLNDACRQLGDFNCDIQEKIKMQLEKNNEGGKAKAPKQLDKKSDIGKEKVTKQSEGNNINVHEKTSMISFISKQKDHYEKMRAIDMEQIQLLLKEIGNDPKVQNGLKNIPNNLKDKEGNGGYDKRQGTFKN